MKLHTYLFKRQLALCSGMVAGALLCGTCAHAGSQSFNFSYSNSVQSQTFTVPSGVTSLNATLSGGPGGCGGWDVWDDPNGARTGGASGGAAKSYQTVLKVTPGEVITLSQGGVGLNGNTCGGCGGATGGGSSVSTGGNGGYTGYHGFSGAGAGGGGASIIYKSNGDAFIIAGGGGGGSGASRACPNSNTAGSTTSLTAVSGLRMSGNGAGGPGNNFGGADGSGGGGGAGGYTAGSGGNGQWDVNTALPEFGVSYCSAGGSGSGGSSAYNPNLVTRISESGTVASCSGAAPVMALTWNDLSSITVNKALGATGRVTATDQFTVQILQNNTVVNNPLNSTTAGSGTVVTAGTGTTGSFSATANTSYAINEVASNGAILARYDSSVSCTRNGTAQPAFSPGGTLTPTGSDAYVCTLTNSPKAATLTVRQMVLGPVPVNLKPPYRFDYTGSNGWPSQPLINSTLNALVASSAAALTATNTATTVSTNLPEPRWLVSAFSCTDTNAAVSGNPTSVLVSAAASSITIPATFVRAGAALRCTLILGHLTP